MDNIFSQVTIQVPTVPTDAESKAGVTKKDLIEYIMLLLRGAQILGINLEQPQNFDLTEIVRRLDANEAAAAKATLKQRVVNMNGVTNATVIVPFDDIGTLQYSVAVTLITPPDTNIATVTWSLIEGSKSTDQCLIRIDGAGSPYKIEVCITEYKT